MIESGQVQVLVVYGVWVPDTLKLNILPDSHLDSSLTLWSQRTSICVSN